jgi:integrase
MQRGQIFRKGGNWYLRFYRDEIKSGEVVRRRVCQKLAPFCHEYRTLKSVRALASEIIAPLNSGRMRPETMLSVSDFIDNAYLPFVREHKRPSTAKGYREIFTNHLQKRLSGIRLRDFRTADGERLLAIIAHNGSLTHRTLLHIKSLLSGVFTYAKRLGVIDNSNPMREVSVPKGLRSAETIAYSLEEVQTMVRALREPERTIVAVAAFTGLRASEIRGLRWEDFTGDEIRVVRTVWRKNISEPKTQASAASVPVLPFLCRTLVEHRNKYGGSYIFETPRRMPMDLHTLGSKVIRPRFMVAASNGRVGTRSVAALPPIFTVWVSHRERSRRSFATQTSVQLSRSM